MSARLGISPIGWSNDDLPELGGDIPLEVCLRQARQAGFEGVELGRKFPRRADALRRALRPHGLALVSGWYGARLLERSVETELSALSAHLDLLLEMECAVLVFAEVSGSVHTDPGAPLSRRPRIPAERWPRFGESLTRVAESLRSRGMRLAYHHHMGTVVETEEEIDRLLATTGDAVGLVLDTGHLTFAGGDVAGVAARHGARIAHLHLKDVRPDVLADVRRRDAPFLEAVRAGVFTVPGQGCVDFRAALAALRAHRYAGWLVVEAEQDPAQADPLAAALAGHRHVRSVARALEVS